MSPIPAWIFSTSLQQQTQASQVWQTHLEVVCNLLCQPGAKFINFSHVKPPHILVEDRAVEGLSYPPCLPVCTDVPEDSGQEDHDEDPCSHANVEEGEIPDVVLQRGSRAADVFQHRLKDFRCIAQHHGSISHDGLIENSTAVTLHKLSTHLNVGISAVLLVVTGGESVYRRGAESVHDQHGQAGQDCAGIVDSTGGGRTVIDKVIDDTTKEKHVTRQSHTRGYGTDKSQYNHNDVPEISKTKLLQEKIY